jgi:hypothetical protein
MGPIALSPGGELIAAIREDRQLQVWRMGESRPVLDVHSNELHQITSLAVSPDNLTIATSGLDGAVRLWDARTGAERRSYEHHSNFTYSVAFSSDGRRVLSGSADSTARLWDAASGQDIAMFAGHRGRIDQAIYAPDGRQVVTASADRTIRQWDAKTGLALNILSGHEQSVDAVMFADEGKALLSVSSDGTVRLWDPRLPASLEDQMTWEEAIESDPLPAEQRQQLGLEEIDPNKDFAKASECDQAADSPYDPNRRSAGLEDWGLSDVAKAVCVDGAAKAAQTPRQAYLQGRAWWARQDAVHAKQNFEIALAKGYQASAVDLADLLLEQAADRQAVQRAIALYEHAWAAGIAIAADRLGDLYESAESRRGVDLSRWLDRDPHKAWAWYLKGVAVNEPYALARLGKSAEQEALAATTESSRDQAFLKALSLYSRASASGVSAHWIRDIVSQWQWHRASLGLLLAHRGHMADVARAYRAVERSKPH